MNLTFHKYHGTGNDFILIDNREDTIQLSGEVIARLCDRHFGIGADGLMFLTSSPGYDFGMTYFNSNGKESTMCGNGGRCITAFARQLGIIEENARFLAIDGEHTAEILREDGDVILVRLKMEDVSLENSSCVIRRHCHSEPKLRVKRSRSEAASFVINTGSPHLVIFTDHVRELDVATEGRKLRNDPQFALEGTNIDFVEIREDSLFVRTYERGVEDVTLSCGTGVTAAALAYASGQWAVTSLRAEAASETKQERSKGSRQSAVCSPQSSGIQHPGSSIQDPASKITAETPGGTLTVSFRQDGDSFTDIWLEGPAEFVFSGEIKT